MPLHPVFSPDFYVRQLQKPIGLLYHFNRSLRTFADPAFYWQIYQSSRFTTGGKGSSTVLDLTGQPYGWYDYIANATFDATFSSYGLMYESGESVSTSESTGSDSMNGSLENSMYARCYINLYVNTSSATPSLLMGNKYSPNAQNTSISFRDYCFRFPCPINISGGGKMFEVSTPFTYTYPDGITLCDENTYYYQTETDDGPFDMDSTEFQDAVYMANYDDITEQLIGIASFGTCARSAYKASGTMPYVTGTSNNRIVIPLTGTPVAFDTPPAGASGHGGNRGQYYCAEETENSTYNTIDSTSYSVSFCPMQIEIDYYYLTRNPENSELEDYGIQSSPWWTGLDGIKPLNLIKGASNIYALLRRVRFVPGASTATITMQVDGSFNYQGPASVGRTASVYGGYGFMDIQRRCPVVSTLEDYQRIITEKYAYLRAKDGLTYWTSGSS